IGGFFTSRTRFAIGSPFLCSDDSEANCESEPAEQRPERHEFFTPSSEFLLAPVVSPPEIRRHSATLIRPGEAIPFGRPYRSHLNRPHSSSSSPPSDHPYPDIHHQTPLMLIHLHHRRFVHRSLARTLRRLSSERSLDSSSLSFRPSRKRCRSPTALVPSLTHDSRLIAPTPVDLLPPHKRFRDSYSSEDSGEEHMEVDTADAEAFVDIGISEGVVAHPKDGVGMGFKIADSDVREDDEEFEAEASAADTREIVVDPLAIGDSFESSRGGILDF
ncbi:hypothetical protein Tco_1536449, partial [Tanacetum coccineum]